MIFPHATFNGMTLKSLGTIALVLVLTVLGTRSLALAGDEPAAWNKDQAAQYLDERAKTWFAFGSAGRGEAETKTTCVSCHTLAPYALGRPALRKLAGASQSTDYEQRLVEQAKLRVEHWDELDSPKFRLLYDFDEQ